MRHLSHFLKAFCATDACDALMAHQQAWLTAVLKKQFGYYGLQLGVATDYAQAWRSCPIGEHFILTDSRLTNTHAVVDFEDLPIANQAIDCVVMSFTLELSHDPYAVLREVDRILINDGRLVVMGFHPLNAWRGQIWGAHRQAASGLSLLGAGRLVDALQTLGYEIQQVDFYPATGWKRWFPWLATPFSQGYGLVAHKKTARVKLIGLRDGWRWQSLLPQLAKRQQADVGVTHREMKQNDRKT